MPVPSLASTLLNISIRALDLLLLLGLWVAVLAHPYVELGLSLELPLPGGGIWAADAPIADLAALLLLPIVIGRFLLARISGASWPPPPPGALGWGLFLMVALTSLSNHPDPTEGLHELLRKPLFAWLAYGLGFAWVVYAAGPGDRVRRAALTGISIGALISLGTSIARFDDGEGLWYQSLDGLTPNHKTIAVCLAGWMPLLLHWSRGSRPAGAIAMLTMAAVLASASKTAILGVGFSLALVFPLGRPLAWRPRLIVPMLILGVALAYYAPVLLGSRTMLDAARSRHSLNERAFMMAQAHPLIGAGIGMSTRVEMVTSPHFRINGVEAHGAVQKVLGETGLLGLGGLLLFVGGAGGRLHRRWKQQQAANPQTPGAALPAYACLATFVVLHGQLLLSTELFNATHWLPLATAWGLAWARPAEPRCAS